MYKRQDADAGAPHVSLADEAIRIGPAPAAESYRNMAALLLSLIHISEPTRPYSISYAVFCLKKKIITKYASATNSDWTYKERLYINKRAASDHISTY